jgi:hypothetical protein
MNLAEVPFALPPGRFEDPKSLPVDFRYEAVNYIYESSCPSTIQVLSLLTLLKITHLLDAVQPSNDGQAAGMSFVSKVGLGRPTENP